MSFLDIKKAFLVVDTKFTTTDKDKIIAAIELAYNGSTLFK